MLIELRFTNLQGVELLTNSDYSELDDVRSIFYEVCEFLEQRGQFVVSGFGQDIWPVDVRTDFSVFLEQLPALLNAVSSGMPIELDFYEQGIERVLTFTPVVGGYVVSCSSQTSWQPNPSSERIDQASLQRMLLSVRDQFLRVLRMISPTLSGHPLIQSWLECRNAQ